MLGNQNDMDDIDIMLKNRKLINYFLVKLTYRFMLFKSVSLVKKSILKYQLPKVMYGGENMVWKINGSNQAHGHRQQHHVASCKGQDAFFQQHDDFKHTAAIVKAYYKSKNFEFLIDHHKTQI